MTPTKVGLMEIKRDHDSTPQSICQHPGPSTRRMWVAAGNPCENEYEEIDLSGLTDSTH